MDDREIVALYMERCERAIRETQIKYGRYCHYIARQILDSEEDAEEIVNDTYLKTWNTIPPAQPESLKPYVGMISRQLAINEFERKQAKKRGGEVLLVLDELAACIPDRESTQIGESVALRDALNKFLMSLSGKTRNIFVRRYWYTSTLSEIAEEYAMKESTVGMILLRTRARLKKFLEKEGIDI
ncbi:MAG: sigma-70 family RNA polymerase sigma factor [Clostridia bacterium]|nr:sigma-70 family RNA polymerase sigma factor [Clostridia bacterium]MBQ7339158.1 sigma-70 family RNA polymerase sigma factor [Clostridia bacterium]